MQPLPQREPRAAPRSAAAGDAPRQRSRRAGAHPLSGTFLLASVVLVGAAVGLGAVSTGRSALAGPGAPRPAAVQQQATHYIPNLQTSGSWVGLAAPADVLGPVIRPSRPFARAADVPDRTLGMDGMGESVFELQNLVDRPIDYTVDLVSTVVSPVQYAGHIGPYGATRLTMEDVPATEFSNYSARLSGTGPLGTVIRTTWYGGASVTFEAPPASTDLILPLVVREVYSHSSIIYIKNLSPPGVYNPITFDLFAEDGSILKEWVVTMRGDEALPDDLYRERVFYRDLPVNAAGGFIGSWQVHSNDPVAILIYGDEPFGVGTSALVAKPKASASTVQYLPLVRANYLGDTLLSVVNAENRAVDVTITYRGHPASPSGADQLYEQRLTLPARLYANIDLSPRERGNVPPPPLPLGGGLHTGFLGSATVQATGRVLATGWEQYVESNYVLGSAAYNAFGPQDLGRAFAVPRAFMAADGQPSFVIAQNPGTEPAEMTFELYNDAGVHFADLAPRTILPGQMSFVPVMTEGFANVRVIARSSHPVAVLVLDARPTRDRTTCGAVKMPDDAVIPTPAAATPTGTAGASPTSGPETPVPTPTTTAGAGETVTATPPLREHIFLPRAVNRVE